MNAVEDDFVVANAKDSSMRRPAANIVKELAKGKSEVLFLAGTETWKGPILFGTIVASW